MRARCRGVEWIVVISTQNLRNSRPRCLLGIVTRGGRKVRETHRHGHRDASVLFHAAGADIKAGEGDETRRSGNGDRRSCAGLRGRAVSIVSMFLLTMTRPYLAYHLNVEVAEALMPGTSQPRASEQRLSSKHLATCGQLAVTPQQTPSRKQKSIIERSAFPILQCVRLPTSVGKPLPQIAK